MAVWISDALIPKPTPTSLEPKPVARLPIVPADSAGRAQVPTQSGILRIPHPLRATHNWSVRASVEPGESSQAVRLAPRPRCVSKNQPSAAPRTRADRERSKSKIEAVGRGRIPALTDRSADAPHPHRAASGGTLESVPPSPSLRTRCEPGRFAPRSKQLPNPLVGRGRPGWTRRRTRSRASGGVPRETQQTAPPANARQPSQPAGCFAFPAYPQKLSGSVCSRCPFAGTAGFFLAVPIAPVSEVPVRNHKNTSLKLDWCQSQDWRSPMVDCRLPAQLPMCRALARP
jgi:hypothetical protein